MYVISNNSEQKACCRHCKPVKCITAFPFCATEERFLCIISGLLQSNFSNSRLTFSISAGILKPWICVAFFTAIWVTDYFFFCLKISVATGYGLNGLGIGVWFPTGARGFFLLHAFRPALRPIQPLLHWDQGIDFWFPVGSGIFSSPRRPDRLWGPPSLLSNGHQGLFPRR
jgi:hypothetical protein